MVVRFFRLVFEKLWGKEEKENFVENPRTFYINGQEFDRIINLGKDWMHIEIIYIMIETRI